MGLLMLVARDFSLLQKFFPMNVFSRYLIRHLFLGFAAAAGLLLPLFTTFNLINELDGCQPGRLSLTQACWWCYDLTAAHWSNFRRLSRYWWYCWTGAVIEKQ